MDPSEHISDAKSQIEDAQVLGLLNPLDHLNPKLHVSKCDYLIQLNNIYDAEAS